MRRENGFTLFEVLVGSAIAALALAVLLRGALDGITATRIDGRYEEAVARARSRLAEVGFSPLPWDRLGDDGGGYRWHVRIVPVSTARTSPLTVLYAVSVVISWDTADGEHGVVDLETERLGPAGLAQ